MPQNSYQIQKIVLSDFAHLRVKFNKIKTQK